MIINNNGPKSYCVLIVDDDQLTLAAEKSLFESHYDIVVAESGCEALEILKSKKFDVVLTDVQMPYMDGITLTKKIRTSLAINKDVVVIGLTASNDDFLKETCIQAGMHAVLAKPVTQQVIMTQLRAKMNRKKQISEPRSLKKLILSKALA